VRSVAWEIRLDHKNANVDEKCDDKSYNETGFRYTQRSNILLRINRI